MTSTGSTQIGTEGTPGPDRLRTPTLAPGARPLVGHAMELKKRAGDFLTSLQNGDGVTLIRVMREPMYVVNDPALIREVLRDSVTYARGGPVTERFRAMFGNGLGVSEGAFHRRQRDVIQPAFQHRRIVRHATLMSGTTERLTEGWKDGDRVQVDKVMDELSLANVATLIFADATVLDRRRFMDATAVLLGGLFRRIGDPTGLLAKLPTRANRRFDEAAAYIHTTIDAVIADYRARGVDHEDLLSMMLFAKDDDGKPMMTDQNLHDEVLTFFIGGSNTIANTLCWAFWEIATHPEVERQLHAELDQVLAGRPLQFDDIAKLDYTRRVVTETLRRRTQGLFLARITTEDTELGGYRIPAGVSVLYSFHALNNNPRIHPEPERFDPDRWLPERAKAIPRGAFIPFSLGVHGCVGDQFAWTEMIVSLATIADRWRLVPDGHVPQAKPAITMPVDALPMRVRRRTAGTAGTAREEL